MGIKNANAAATLEALRTQLAAAGRGAQTALVAMKQAVHALGFGSENPAFQVLADSLSSGGRLVELIDALVQRGISRTEIATFILPAVSVISNLSGTEVARLGAWWRLRKDLSTTNPRKT
jgi:hypothetical protein